MLSIVLVREEIDIIKLTFYVSFFYFIIEFWIFTSKNYCNYE